MFALIGLFLGFAIGVVVGIIVGMLILVVHIVQTLSKAQFEEFKDWMDW